MASSRLSVPFMRPLLPLTVRERGQHAATVPEVDLLAVQEKIRRLDYHSATDFYKDLIALRSVIMEKLSHDGHGRAEGKTANNNVVSVSRSMTTTTSANASSASTAARSMTKGKDDDEDGHDGAETHADDSSDGDAVLFTASAKYKAIMQAFDTIMSSAVDFLRGSATHNSVKKLETLIARKEHDHEDGSSVHVCRADAVCQLWRSTCEAMSSSDDPCRRHHDVQYYVSPQTSLLGWEQFVRLGAELPQSARAAGAAGGGGGGGGGNGAEMSVELWDAQDDGLTAKDVAERLLSAVSASDMVSQLLRTNDDDDDIRDDDDADDVVMFVFVFFEQVSDADAAVQLMCMSDMYRSEQVSGDGSAWAGLRDSLVETKMREDPTLLLMESLRTLTSKALQVEVCAHQRLSSLSCWSQ